MKRALTIVIDSGEKTCATEPGKFCQRLLLTRFGTEWVCGLFRDSNGNHVKLTDTNGDGTCWLLRCRECLESEAK